MRAPSAEELAAIAAAYAIVSAARAAEVPAEPIVSRWALAARLRDDEADARTVATGGNRWARASRPAR
ncbi:MAG: hypothetical protein JO225_05165 [Candidatus Eremiobacteraeota bacterium]|nr:hypothetical protein [Candidatus Eremiobacteraeota bacterium]